MDIEKAVEIVAEMGAERGRFKFSERHAMGMLLDAVIRIIKEAQDEEAPPERD